MNLYLVHCGYYDPALLDGVYEFHVNLMVAAISFDDARARAKLHPDFKGRKMHVDGVQEIQAVDGMRVQLSADPALEGQTVILSKRHRDFAPAAVPAAAVASVEFSAS